jgi:hypothetical protein
MQKIKQTDDAMRKILQLCSKLQSLCKQVGYVPINVCYQCDFIGMDLDYMETSSGGGRERPFCK